MADVVGLPLIENKTGYTDPFRFNDPNQFKALMLETLAHSASDVFIQPGKPVVAQVSGRLMAVTRRIIDTSEARQILKWATDRDTSVTDLLERKAVNGRYELFDPTARAADSGAKIRYGYRVNAVQIHDQGGTGLQIVIRAIPLDPPTPQQVGLDDDLLRAATPRNGIVYVCGSTGSGKTTTFAAVIRHVLEGDTPIKGSIITYEEPIEFLFGGIKSSHSIIVQTQIPEMLLTFYDAIREAMRRAPKLIVIGELRDEQTIRAAVEASMTGHTVFGTVHASNVATVVRRLISRFPEEQRATAIFDIVETTRLIIAQRLVRTREGKLIAAREYLEFSDEMRDQLSGLSNMGAVTAVVKQLVASHGHSFAQEADRLFAAGVIDDHVANELGFG